VRDLSHPIEDGMPVYPGDPPVSVEPYAKIDTDGYRVTALGLGSHAGTHVDAPSHLEPDGDTLGDYDVDDFRFDARVVHVDPGARGIVEPNAIPDTDADIVVFATGWSDLWRTGKYRDHPALAPETARVLAERGQHVGIDAPSVDPPESEAFPAHHHLLGSGSLILENLTNLAGLPERVTIHAYPLSVDADGAPARVVADVE